jgi:hypothetical protein
MLAKTEKAVFDPVFTRHPEVVDSALTQQIEDVSQCHGQITQALQRSCINSDVITTRIAIWNRMIKIANDVRTLIVANVNKAIATCAEKIDKKLLSEFLLRNCKVYSTLCETFLLALTKGKDKASGYSFQQRNGYRRASFVLN